MLRVKTYRQGVAAKVGHDLVIEVTSWEATLEVGEDPTQSTVVLSVDPGSFEIREGTGGMKPLTDKDRADIGKNMNDKVLRGKPIAFRSTSVEAAGGDGSLVVHGDLELAEATRPASFPLAVGADGRVTGKAELTQSEWGIKPYSGLMGALKVRDSVEVEIEGQLPG